ncbi:SAGA-associated factor 29 [Tolypocladium ophioglossoides CBS 100239]|uniref:SAGA-associated factor 29 n=1 Tax=Tolypocladium ophioglossoides (strain CBS 100239) TaxID=1163406 RepID=A0A0L0MXK0_TOLOC|nr:SAGA-associated factor 29 [Tolypocladium ophioglossoides CBS 100239]
MADKKRQRRSELDNLREELGPWFHQTSPRRGGPETPRPGSGSGSGSGSSNNNGGSGTGSTINNNNNNTNTGGNMSQRNRSGRGSNRNNGNSSHGEEAQIWESCKNQMADIVAGVNAENDSLGELVELDKKVGAMDPDKVPNDSLKQLEQLCRKGVKFSEANISSLKAVTEQLKILRAVRAAARDRDRDSAAAASVYDFNSAGNSPVPSPIGGSGPGGGSGSSRKHAGGGGSGGAGGGGDRSSNRDRDSIPPKADSAEPAPAPGSAAGAGSAGSNKSKVVFAKGDAVAFRPTSQASDWILGEVAQVMGESKSRRYKVLDIETDPQSKQKEYKSSASSMIAIAPESAAATLKDWEAGKVVLALYPNTTTFYKAEVHSMDGDGRVNLKFEGENDSTTLQQVERRFVIEYRG